MRVISVASHGNGAGKTRLLESLLASQPGRFGAIKFTTIFRDGQFCPKDAQRSCACTRLHADHEIVADEAVLMQAGTDTGRLWSLGARPLLWCLAKEGAHAAAWIHAQELLDGCAELLTEGNTALSHVKSDLLFFIVNPCAPRAAWKPNWKELAQRADAILVNEAEVALGRRRPAGAEERLQSLREVEEAAPQTPRVVARFESPWSEWAGPYLEDLIGTRRG